MRFILAFLLLTTPAFAWGLGPHPDGWYQVTRGGWAYWMPPAVCTVGPMPKHKVFYKSLAWMEKHFGKGALGQIVIGSYGMKLYVAANMGVVTRDNLIHEEAEARGCGDDPYDRQHTKHG